jgi:outer membrane protein
MKKNIRILIAGAMLASVAATPVFAQDDLTSPWQFRLRALGVIPNSSGSSVHVAGVPALSSPNSSLSIDNTIVPELDISYFFTKNISAELVLGTTPHHVTGTGALSGLSVGKAWLLPPTITGQYHFTDFGPFQPYVGAGLNATLFYDQKAADAPLGGLAVTSLHIRNAFSPALQFGFDYMLDAHWGLNVDAKYLFLEPHYTAVVNHAIGISGTADVDPWLVGAGITYRL